MLVGVVVWCAEQGGLMMHWVPMVAALPEVALGLLGRGWAEGQLLGPGERRNLCARAVAAMQAVRRPAGVHQFLGHPWQQPQLC